MLNLLLLLLLLLLLPQQCVVALLLLDVAPSSLGSIMGRTRGDCCAAFRAATDAGIDGSSRSGDDTLTAADISTTDDWCFNFFALGRLG